MREIRAANRPDTRISRSLRQFLALEDFERAARRRLPRQIYGYFAGSAETGAAFADNTLSYRGMSLVPRVLQDTRRRSTAATLFGRDYGLPIGIAPMGLSGLSTFQGDLILGRAAKAEQSLAVMSATSLMPLEKVRTEAGSSWFQAYLPGELDRIRALVSRVESAGYDTLVVTVDVPVAANRENNARTGFSIPLRPGPRLFWDGLTHPRWSMGTFLRTLATGMPRFENMDAFRGPPILSRNAVRDIGERDGLTWTHLSMIRDHWKGRLVIKGIVSPQDADIARERGLDGVWISNHGGRQLDGTVAPLRMLREIVTRAGDMAVLIDGGIRRGSDVLKALAMGADFVFIGRPFLFAAACGGEPAVRHAFGLVRAELARNMAMIGVSNLSDLTAEHVWPALQFS